MDAVSHGDSDVHRARSMDGPAAPTHPPLVESGAEVVISMLITSAVHPFSSWAKETGEDKTSCVTHLYASSD